MIIQKKNISKCFNNYSYTVINHISNIHITLILNSTLVYWCGFSSRPIRAPVDLSGAGCGHSAPAPKPWWWWEHAEKIPLIPRTVEENHRKTIGKWWFSIGKWWFSIGKWWQTKGKWWFSIGKLWFSIGKWWKMLLFHGISWDLPSLVNKQFANWKMVIEIVDFPRYNMVIVQFAM